LNAVTKRQLGHGSKYEGGTRNNQTTFMGPKKAQKLS
jgi:hypothetical protein